VTPTGRKFQEIKWLNASHHTSSVGAGISYLVEEDNEATSAELVEPREP